MDKQMKQADEHPFLTMTLVLGEHQCQKFVRLAKEKGLRRGIIVLGKGTVRSAALNLLGIKTQKVEIVSILVEEGNSKELLDYFCNELDLLEPGNGIVYTTRVTLGKQIMSNAQGTWNTAQGMEVESMFKKLTVVVNRGMAEDVMDIARKSGVKGGTIMHGRGTEFAAKLFGMEIEPEKELVMILMPSDLVDNVVNVLFQELQLDVPGNGILFVEPIVEVRGLFGSHCDSNNA